MRVHVQNFSTDPEVDKSDFARLQNRQDLSYKVQVESQEKSFP